MIKHILPIIDIHYIYLHERQTFFRNIFFYAEIEKSCFVVFFDFLNQLRVFSALCYIWRAQSSPYFPWWQKEMLWILMTSKVTKSLNFAYTPCSNWLCKLLLPVETKKKRKKNQFFKKSLNGIILFKKAIKNGTCHLGLLIWTLYNSTLKDWDQ